MPGSSTLNVRKSYGDFVRASYPEITALLCIFQFRLIRRLGEDGPLVAATAHLLTSHTKAVDRERSGPTCNEGRERCEI